jgi:hypothetical protein
LINLGQGLFRKNSRFTAITFKDNPKAATIFGVTGIGVNIKKSATVIPSGEIVATNMRLNTQSHLLRLE